MGEFEREERQGPRSASALDQYVGFLVKQRREQLGISQVDLAKALGISFQQLQKYERGGNRISAGRLFEIADILGVEMNWFFEGAQSVLVKATDGFDESLDSLDNGIAPEITPLEMLASLSGTGSLLQAYGKLASSEARRQAVAIVRVLGKS